MKKDSNSIEERLQKMIKYIKNILLKIEWIHITNQSMLIPFKAILQLNIFCTIYKDTKQSNSMCINPKLAMQCIWYGLYCHIHVI